MISGRGSWHTLGAQVYSASVIESEPNFPRILVYKHKRVQVNNAVHNPREIWFTSIARTNLYTFAQIILEATAGDKWA